MYDKKKKDNEIFLSPVFLIFFDSKKLAFNSIRLCIAFAYILRRTQHLCLNIFNNENFKMWKENVGKYNCYFIFTCVICNLFIHKFSSGSFFTFIWKLTWSTKIIDNVSLSSWILLELFCICFRTEFRYFILIYKILLWSKKCLYLYYCDIGKFILEIKRFGKKIKQNSYTFFILQKVKGFIV